MMMGKTGLRAAAASLSRDARFGGVDVDNLAKIGWSAPGAASGLRGAIQDGSECS